ncbi:alpha/beta hydrolase [Pedobacter sp.]|uniref:alpha/beta hydrolase n=1 Tax=Pedobacter sp. TaxID=1411316 RepID=UPI003BA95057
MKKRYKAFWALTFGLVVGYLLGPKPKKPVYNEELPQVPELPELEDYVHQKESGYKIKPGNEAEIVWAYPNHQQTEYALIYLHGFSASKYEGNPVHLNLAKKLNANLYLPRLAEHGLESLAPMQYLTADMLWESCKEAYVIGQKLGKRVILMGSSTGGTMALKLAANYPEIHSLILISPNIEINDKKAWMLNDPWGLQIARRVLKSDQRKTDDRTEEFRKYWYTSYRIESLVQLQELVEGTMTRKLFQRVKQPVLMLYYYKNELEQDLVVRVSAMLKMFNQLGSVQKQKVAIPNGGNHILASYIISKDLPGVEEAIEKFMKETLKIMNQ